MATSQEILKLSQQSSSSQRPSALLDHKCDESNITAYAMQAGYFKNNQLQSLSLRGFTSLEQDGKAIKKELKDVAVDLLEDLSKTLRKDDIFENFLLDEKARLMQQIEEKTSLKSAQSLTRKERLIFKSLKPLSSKAQ